MPDDQQIINMAALIQTIAIVDKSGKAVSTVSIRALAPWLTQLTDARQSKHLVNVFKEAKAAYLERKAEVAASRHYDHEENTSRKALKGATVDGNRPAASRTHSQRGSSSRPSAHHRHTGTSVRSESRTIYPASDNRHSQELRSPSSPRSPHSLTFKPEGLARRHSAHEDEYDGPRPGALAKRSMTSPLASPSHIDMDLAYLAYGPISPPLPVARKGADEEQFKGLVQKVRRILEEADCLQYSASAIITTLQKNPDAMAAVALTLAEISNIVTKMAPGVLTAMKGSSPAVFALLASPQFLIAGGVAVGVTIVAFGGFKIIKKIRAKNAIEVPGMDEMVEIGGDVSRIDNWRRGIAEEQEQSIGTSVDGEFITPHAAALSQLNLNEARASETTRKEVGSGSKKASSSKGESEKGSKKSTKGSSRGSSKASSKGTKKDKKVKKPSPLRLMFS